MWNPKWNPKWNPMKNLITKTFAWILVQVFFIQLLGTCALANPTKPEADLSPFTKVSVILASATDGLSPSSFGHLYLRFSRGEKLDYLDQVLEIVAETPVEDLSLFRGLGIVNSYSMIAHLLPYTDVYYQKTHLEDRDLTTYTLNLTPEKHRNLIAKIETILKNKDFEKKDYAFFWRNCATAVAEVLSEIDFQAQGIGGLTPKGILQQLKEKNFISSEFSEMSLSKKRNLLIKDYSTLLTARGVSEETQKQLASYDLIVRAHAWGTINPHMFEWDKKDNTPFRFWARVANLEPSFLRPSLRDFDTRKQLVPIKALNLSRTRLRTAPRQRPRVVESVILPGSDDHPVLKARVHLGLEQGLRGPKPIVRELLFSLPDLRIQNDFVYLDQEKVGAFLDSSLGLGKFWNHRLFTTLSFTFENGDWFAKAFAVVDLSIFDGLPPWDNSTQTFPYINGLNKSPGVCLTLVFLQQAFLERAVFNPEAKIKDSPQRTLEKLQSLLEGNFAVFNGLTSPRDLYNSVDQRQLINLIVKTHYRERYAQFSTAAVDWFGMVYLRTESQWKSLARLTQMGVTIPIFFQALANEVRGGHSYLVRSIVDKGPTFEVEYYDPNFGILQINSKVFVDKKTLQLHHAFYKTGTVQFDPRRVRSSDVYRSLSQGPARNTLIRIDASDSRRLSPVNSGAPEVLEMENPTLKTKPIDLSRILTTW